MEAADEANLPFLASALTFDGLMAFIPFVLLFLLAVQLVAGDVDLNRLAAPFLPQDAVPGGTARLAAAQRLLERISGDAGRVSLVATPLFLWFSTRLFAGIRGSLNFIYASQARRPEGGAILAYLKAKLRDLGMVFATLALLLTNAALSTLLALASSRGAEAIPAMAFLFTLGGRLVGEGLAFLFLVSLFLLLYRYASFRQLTWRNSLVASLVSAVAFEIAKRLFGLYLREVVSLERMAVDADLGAILLAMLWMWYTSFVFLLGAVVADLREHPDRPHRQSPILT